MSRDAAAGPPEGRGPISPGGARPRVSVVMVCRDGHPYLGAALASLEAQTFPHWELVFRDNGSRDGSAGLAGALGHRARVLPSSAPVSVGRARNEALAAARGDLVTFLDADDLWEPHKLARQVALHARAPRSLLFGGCHVIDARDRRLGLYAEGWPPVWGPAFDALVRSNFIPLPTVAVPRDVAVAAGGFDGRLRSAHDYDLWLRVARDHELAYDPVVLASYRIHPGNMTASWRGVYRENALLYRRLARRLDGDGDAPLRDAWTRLHLRWALHALGRGEVREAARSVRGVFRGPKRCAPGPSLLALARAVPALLRGPRLRLRMLRARRGSAARTLESAPLRG